VAKKKSALRLEAVLRGFVARARFAATLRRFKDAAATTIETWWRGALAKACLNFVRRLTAPWQGVLPSKHEFVVCATVVVWHRYTNMGRMGEVVGSRKLNLVVTNKGNLIFASGGGAHCSGGVSVYNPEATPAAVRVIQAGGKNKTSFVLPNLMLSPTSGRKKLPAGREQPSVIVDPDLPPQPMPVTRFDLKMKKGVRTVSMHLTDLAGTYERWYFLKDVFDAKDWAALTPKNAMRLNLDESIANLPIDCCGFVYKSPFKRRIINQRGRARPASSRDSDYLLAKGDDDDAKAGTPSPTGDVPTTLAKELQQKQQQKPTTTTTTTTTKKKSRSRRRRRLRRRHESCPRDGAAVRRCRRG